MGDVEVGGRARREWVVLGVRWMAGLGFVLCVMVVIANLFRRPLENLGRSFVDHFGYAGMAFGTFIADGFHCPIPPQFYMLMAVSSGASQPLALAVITVASLLGGVAGYTFAGKLARYEIVAKRLSRSREVAQRAFSRAGYSAAFATLVLPIPYSVLCYLAGLHGLPRGIFAVLSLCRVPRLLMFFYLVRLGWSF